MTTCRSDYGPAHWLIHDMFAAPRIEARLIVSGSHLSPQHGLTVDEIERDGWPIAERVDFYRDIGDDARTYGAALGFAATAFTDVFERLRLSAVVVLGDRLELLAIATAAVITRTPIAHVSGGDLTAGALDEQVRHAVTKMAHVHFPGTEESAARIRQMGEEAWRVHTVGDPALDHFRRGERSAIAELEELFGFGPNRDTLLVTQHPVTIAPDVSIKEAEELASALRQYRGPIVITAPGPDPGSADVRAIVTRLVNERRDTVFVESLGSRRYRAMLELVGAMVGNSSSGLIEAASTGLPVVNIGQRQQGRQRGANVIDSDANAAAITAAIERAMAPEFRASLIGLTNPYGDGRAAGQIVEVLSNLPPRARLLTKHFLTPSSAGDDG